MNTISIIVAMDKNNVIGTDNQIPWHLPDDLVFFKKNTLNKPVIMGRKTFASIGAKPLVNRTNIVVSRQKISVPEEVILCHNFNDALNHAKVANKNITTDAEIMIIGGAQIYKHFLDTTNKIYITLVNTVVDSKCPTVFPNWDSNNWHTIHTEHHPIDDNHKFSFTFKILKKT